MWHFRGLDQLLFILLAYLYRVPMAGISALEFWTVAHLRRRLRSLETSLGICVRVWTQASYVWMMFACMLYLAAGGWQVRHVCGAHTALWARTHSYLPVPASFRSACWRWLRPLGAQRWQTSSCH